MRVTRIRQVTQHHGVAELPVIYATIAQELYVPSLAPDFAYIDWRNDYELEPFATLYDAATAGTNGFVDVDVASLAELLGKRPAVLKVFRTMTGLTTQEFAVVTGVVGQQADLASLSNNRIKTLEKGGKVKTAEARVVALTIDGLMDRTLFAPSSGTQRLKQDKPDTAGGWSTLRNYARHGVPLSVFLHQRHYGGAFRQLLDATSTKRGDVIEDAVEALFLDVGVPFIRTGAHNQAQIEGQFGLTVRPAPDFVIYDGANQLRAILECKGANDGGTARDKAGRFHTLRAESQRLGGVPLFGVLAGLGWRRVNDTLGPVVRDCDGRVFTAATLPQMLTVQPFPQLISSPAGPTSNT